MAYVSLGYAAKSTKGKLTPDKCERQYRSNSTSKLRDVRFCIPSFDIFALSFDRSKGHPTIIMAEQPITERSILRDRVEAVEKREPLPYYPTDDRWETTKVRESMPPRLPMRPRQPHVPSKCK